MPIFEKTYKTKKTNLPIIIPASGKKLKIKKITSKTNVNLKLEFIDSIQTIANLTFTGSIFFAEQEMNVNITGNIDESLSLTCDGETTVKIEYEEI